MNNLMSKIPKYSPLSTIVYVFNGRLQIWYNPCYSCYVVQDVYQLWYSRTIIRLGKIIICITKEY